MKQRFGNEPATEYELAHLLASTYRSLSRDADALPLATRALALAQSHFGPGSPQALRTARTLAEIQYWTDNFAGARQTLGPVVQPLLAHMPRESRDAFALARLHAEIECAGSTAESARERFTELKRHTALLSMNDRVQRWALADLAGREALCLSRGGDWTRALASLYGHASEYETPPDAHRKTALYHREFQLSAEILVGEPSYVERSARELIAEWTKLAGERSDRIDTLLTVLAQHHLLRGDASKTLGTIAELERRLALKPPPEYRATATALLMRLEAETLFNAASPASILDRLDALVEQLLAHGNRELPRFRQHLFQAGIIALTLERTDLAERYVELGRRLGRDRAPSSAIRDLQLASMLASAHGRYAEAITLYERRLASFDERGERVSLRRAMLGLGHAYHLWLSGERRAQVLEAALARAEASAPPTLPADGLYRLQLEWLRALFLDGEGCRAEQSARERLAARLGRTAASLPRGLNGLFLL